MKVEVEELVTGAEIARRLGISRARQHQLTTADGFPAALGRIGRANVWRWRDVARWADRSHRRVVTKH